MTFILPEGARLRMTEGGAWQSALPAPSRDLDSVGMMIPMSPIPRPGRTVTFVRVSVDSSVAPWCSMCVAHVVTGGNSAT